MIFIFTKKSQTLTYVFKLYGKSWYFHVGVKSHLVPDHAIVFNRSFMSSLVGFLNNLLNRIIIQSVKCVYCFRPEINPFLLYHHVVLSSSCINPLKKRLTTSLSSDAFSATLLTYNFLMIIYYNFFFSILQYLHHPLLPRLFHFLHPISTFSLLP